MTTVVHNIGEKGTSGSDGTNGIGTADINGYKTDRVYTSMFANNAISEAITWDRGSDGVFQNRYDQQQIVSPATAQQHLNWSNDIVTPNWADLDTNWSRTATGVLDPFGNNEAQEITFTDTTSDNEVLTGFTSGVVIGDAYRVSLYIQLVSGTIDEFTIKLGGASSTGVSINTSLITNDWNRIDVIARGESAGFFNIYVGTTGAVVNIYEVNVTTGVNLYDPVNTNGSGPTTFNTGSTIYRANDSGFLIQPEAENLLQYSEDLRQWQVTGATLSQNPAFDSFGSDGSYTRLSITNNSLTVAKSAIGLTSGDSYFVSFFAVVESGSLSSFAVSLGGDPVTVTAGTTYARQIVELTATTSDSITFTATSSESNTVIILGGIQIETSRATGYIPTGEGSNTRLSDNVTSQTYALPSLARPFTVVCSWVSVAQDDSDKFLFNVSDSFTARLNGSNAIIRAGGSDLITASIGDIQSGEVIIVFDGMNLIAYIDKIQQGSALFSGETAAPTSFNIGSSDGLGSDSLNGYIRALTFYDYAASSDDVNYISEID